MECPHLSPHVVRVPSVSDPFNCTVCGSGESPWLCLTCSSVHCGRYIHGHAKSHFEEKSHPLAIDCYSLNTFCYKCDEFITNQHRIPPSVFDRLNAIHEQRTRKKLIRADDDESSNSSSGSTTTDESIILTASGRSASTDSPKASRRRSRRKKRTRRGPPKPRRCKVVKVDEPSLLPPPTGGLSTRAGRKRSSGDYDSGTGSENSNSDLSSQSNSTDSMEAKKRRLEDPLELNGSRRAKENVALNASKGAGKHGVVGLRNLGNTCFMNAVLQSLSKIRGFSCYIAHIPPPAELLNSIESPSQPTRRIYSTRSHKNRLLAASSQNALNAGGRTGTATFEIVASPNTEAMEIQIMRTEELLTNELRKILILLNTKGSSAVSPDSLFSIIWEVMPRFRGYQQQDAHEFLRYMLDQLHTELIRLIPSFSWNGLSSRNGSSNGEVYLKSLGGKSLKTGHLPETFMSVFGYNSIVTSMFGGILENEVRCSRCGTESRKSDPFLDLSLDIPMGSGGEARLEDCLSNFTDFEELSDNDKYFCSNCKTHQKSTKRFSIQRLPNVLCLHLKRFRWSNYLRTKLDHFVQFPMSSLDMSDYLLEKCHTRGSASSHVYDLAAVIVHHGTGVGSGHYTAFAKKDGQWYHFNDSAVKPSDESSVAKCKAYILFYTRAEFRV